jgi:hypothetical protein
MIVKIVRIICDPHAATRFVPLGLCVVFIFIATLRRRNKSHLYQALVARCRRRIYPDHRFINDPETDGFVRRNRELRLLLRVRSRVVVNVDEKYLRGETPESRFESGATFKNF